MEWVKNIGGFFKDNSDLFKGLGGLAGGAGALWSAYNQQNMANKNFDLQKQAFNYNVLQNEEEKKRRKAADSALLNAFNNSTYA